MTHFTSTKSLLSALVLLFTLVSSTSAFFFKVRTLPRPLSSPAITVTKYHNETVRKRERRIERPRVSKALERDQEGTASAPKEDATGLAAKARKVLKYIGRLLYSVKATCAVVAIQVVLSLKMERAVIQRLPLDILLFLLEVSINRPEVMESVARELGERISSEVGKFTGKEKYEVGGITKAIVSRYTGKENYHFGDLWRATCYKFSWNRKHRISVDQSKVELKTATFPFRRSRTGKDNQKDEELESILFKITGKKDYEFGDVTKAVLKKIKTGS